MVAVKTGAPMVPMGGMPMGGGMPMSGAPQPNNMMPPQMPLQPVPPIGQPFPMQQGSSPIPPNANRRKRFGDSLETMLASNVRPAAPVASDQMGGMNVFTGQMMNTARPPVVGMRGGGIVRHMRRGGSSMADYSGASFKAAQSAASQRNPGRTGAMTHDQIMSSIRGGSSPNDDRPAPVVVTAPVVPMDFGDDNNYTPTSAELNEALKDTAAIGMPDLRSDTSYVPDFDMIKSGNDTMNPDRRDAFNQEMVDRSAAIAASKIRSAGGFDDVEMARGTGGLSSVPSISIPSGTSSTLAQNMITFPESPDTGMQPGPAYSPSGMPNTSMQPGPAYSPSDMPNTGMTAGPAYLPLEAPLSAANIDLPEDVANALSNLGLGDPNATSGGAGGGKGGTDTSSGEEDDRGFVEKFKDDVKQFIEMGKKDAAMAIAAGLFGSRATRFDKLIKAGYTKDEANSFLDRSEQTMKDMMDKQAQQSAQDGDDPKDVVGAVVDPCPAGMRLDPVAGICVPIEEGEDEGPSYDLNRSRDDEFNELDDIMKKIVKPVGESDDVRTMQAGGSVGLNRVADNFLAAMGG
jgi:hypothetical protein